MNDPWKTMQTEDYVTKENKALDDNVANNNVRKCTLTTVVHQVLCSLQLTDLIQREQHRNPEWSFLTSSETSSERENSGFSV